MSIADEVAQLRNIAEQVKNDATGLLMSCDSTMDSLQGQASQILMGTYHVEKINGLFHQNDELRKQAAMHMQALAGEIEQTANAIMNSGS